MDQALMCQDFLTYHNYDAYCANISDITKAATVARKLRDVVL